MNSASLMQEAGHLKPVLWDIPEGCGGEGGGWGFRMGVREICVYLWPIHVNAWQNHHKILK